MADKDYMEFLQGQEADLKGFEDVNAETVSIPFLKLAQDLTPQTKKTKPNYIEGLEPGMFFNSATNEVFGALLTGIVLKFERLYIEWLPDRGGFVGYHSPENAKNMATDQTFGKWKTAEGNDLVEYYAYYLLIEGHEHEGPIVYSMTSAAIKIAKGLNRLMTTHIMPNDKRAMPYYLKWKIEAVHVEKGANDWYQPKFVFDGYINEEQYRIIQPERLALPDKPVDYAQLGDGEAKTTSDYNDDDL